MKSGYALDLKQHELFSFHIFGLGNFHLFHKHKMSDKQKVKFMYRKPDASEHQNLPDVMDEIILTLRNIEQRLIKLEEKS